MSYAYDSLNRLVAASTAGTRAPGYRPLTEQVFYNLLVGFLTALTQTGVAACGSGAVEPLSGRTEPPGPRV